jgi:hypothetical protein
MKPVITYRLVPRGTPEFEDLQRFAGTFNHTLVPHPQINVYAHYRDGVLFGYSEHVFIPTVYPAFHPEFTRPQDVVQVMNDWKAHVQFSGALGYIGTPLNDDWGRLNFTDKVMDKLGLYRMAREIFSLNA